VATIISCSAMAFAAPQPAPSVNQPLPQNPKRMAPPPVQPPLYALSQQTTTPVETLSTVVKNIPTMETGKRYEIRVEVREVAPPFALEMDVPRI
ncbi:TPA: hypothetical protein KYD85_004491, partial [Escherichia coli]|nr:hypothetical protein [Escherichia coli]